MSGAASPFTAYQQAIRSQGFESDHAQWQAVDLLEKCYQALHQQNGRDGEPIESIPGVYLWGPVGRGKTWLMDRFYQSLEVPCRRQHFHHFIRWVHQRLFQLSGTPDPLPRLASELASEVHVLCLDELFVNDIADAMILGRLLNAICEQGVVLVTTSNQAPNQLYANGFNRDRFMPAIVAIERSMQVINLDGGQDHRLHPGEMQQRYWLRQAEGPGPLVAVFDRLSTGQPVNAEPVALGHRRIIVEQRSERILWCRYAALCEQPLAALDFITLCDRFSYILLSDVPRLNGKQQAAAIARGTEDGVERVEAGDRELPPLSRHDDGVRRFIALVDECYDRRIPLYIEAEVPLNELYTQGFLSFPFRRTLSRLQEMQLKRFGKE